MARLCDFHYLRYAAPQRKRGCEVLGEAHFNIRGEPTADGDDFATALAAFKRLVPPALRSWDGEKKLWHVFVTEQVRAALCVIFENAERLFLEVELQPALPGLEPEV